MNIKEKGIINKELEIFHEDMERWLLKWFPATAREIRKTLNGKFEGFRETLKNKLKV